MKQHANRRAANAAASYATNSITYRPGDTEIQDCKRALDLARALGDALRIQLAEAALNDILERRLNAPPE